MFKIGDWIVPIDTGSLRPFVRLLRNRHPPFQITKVRQNTFDTLFIYFVEELECSFQESELRLATAHEILTKSALLL